MQCPRCQNHKANESVEYGILLCDFCTEEDSKIGKPTKSYDFASPTTKLHRKQYAKSMLQPWVNGVLSREYVEAWGTDGLANVTKKDVKNSKYVYKNMTRHHKISDSKI